MKIFFAVALACVALSAFAETFSNVDTPNLVSARPHKSKVILQFTHPSATIFSVRVIWQDEGITSPSTSFVKNPEAKEITPGLWEIKTKILGDTNRYSVAVFGMTNWSNEIAVIP